MRVVRDILDSLEHSGFRRILLVNGHGGNAPAEALAIEWMADHPHVQVKFHNWWNAPRTWAKVQEIDPMGSHASWMENFPWTRLAGCAACPTSRRSCPTAPGMARLVGEEMRDFLRRRQLRRLLPACRTKRCWPCGRSPWKRRAS